MMIRSICENIKLFPNCSERCNNIDNQERASLIKEIKICNYKPIQNQPMLGQEIPKVMNSCLAIVYLKT